VVLVSDENINLVAEAKLPEHAVRAGLYVHHPANPDILLSFVTSLPVQQAMEQQ
jgi:hypothetical protein